MSLPRARVDLARCGPWSAVITRAPGGRPMAAPALKRAHRPKDTFSVVTTLAGAARVLPHLHHAGRAALRQGRHGPSRHTDFIQRLCRRRRSGRVGRRPRDGQLGQSSTSTRRSGSSTTGSSSSQSRPRSPSCSARASSRSRSRRRSRTCAAWDNKFALGSCQNTWLQRSKANHCTWF